MRAMRTKRRIVPGLGRICTKNAIRIFQKKKIPLSLSLLQKQFICLRLRSLYEIPTFEARRGETIKSRLSNPLRIAFSAFFDKLMTVHMRKIASTGARLMCIHNCALT